MTAVSQTDKNLLNFPSFSVDLLSSVSLPDVRVRWSYQWPTWVPPSYRPCAFLCSQKHWAIPW